MTLSGYVYFGSSFLFCFWSDSTASVTALYSDGAERKRSDGSSRLVKNDVLTLAPFSYTTVAAVGIAQEEEEEEEENKVNVGANRKNFMFFS